ncbi:SPARC-like [Limulus polyphemus]|uniref:SPARC-like n=1 Tax=Limulus polyphemus TaxID=6850 RepID=A0ABM1SER3_LIMPO|nr:SPARC-like [Limulus polyphemus]
MFCISRLDPCAGLHCGAGRICVTDEQEKPVCDCVSECPVETDERRKVCSNHNETWSSDCEVHRMRCLCNKGSEECLEKKYDHVHVDYYGTCIEIPECIKEEMGDFPRRIREWLFAVMQELALRGELGAHYMKLEEEAEEDLSRKWVNAIIWKFCDLDSHPEDRAVSRHELFPIRAPLLAMEHCIAPFLDNCDSDSDHIITLVEWGSCLGLKERGSPWGFRIQGGRQACQLIRISSLIKGGKAELQGVKEGDVLEEINGHSAASLSEIEIHRLILSTGNTLNLLIRREENQPIRSMFKSSAVIEMKRKIDVAQVTSKSAFICFENLHTHVPNSSREQSYRTFNSLYNLRSCFS